MDIILKNICKSFEGRQVLKDFTATFSDGKVTCITGPSGCGKSTLLSIVAGILRPDSGSVEGTSGAKMAFAFQEPRLLPWKSVVENVEFVLPEPMGAYDRRIAAMKALELVEMESSSAEWPSTLSGGMAQRVSLARAIVTQPSILLLDEPFSALDGELKKRIAGRLGKLWSDGGTTVLMVTHSPEEFPHCNQVRIGKQEV